MSKECLGYRRPSLAEGLMMLLNNDLFKTVSFVVSDAMQVGFPISFVSDGFCRLTGADKFFVLLSNRMQFIDDVRNH